MMKSKTIKSTKLYVIKRGKFVYLYIFKFVQKYKLAFADGRKEEVHFDKITSRIQKLCYNLNMDFVDPVSVEYIVCILDDEMSILE